jgi:hypothetical protein
MGRLDYVFCRNCGRHASEVGIMSHTRLCAECGCQILAENVHSMISMEGRFALHWRRQMAASVGAVLVDDVRLAS